MRREAKTFEPSVNSRWWVVAWSAWAVVVTLLAVRVWWLTVPPSADLVASMPGTWGFQDFRDAIYFPVVAWLEGHDPYDPVAFRERYPVAQHFPLYSPLTLWMHLPLGLLSYPAAAVVYFGWTVLVMLWIAGIALRWSGTRRVDGRDWRLPTVAALLLISRPGHMNLAVGNCTATVVWLVSIAWRDARTAPVRSGIAVALATFKPTFGVPLWVLLWARGASRCCWVALTVGIAATVAVVATVIARAGSLAEFTAHVRANAAVFIADPGSSAVVGYARIDAVAGISRLAGQSLSGVWELAVLGGVLALAAALLRRASQRGDGESRLSGEGLACSAILIGCYHQTYDGLLLAGFAVGWWFQRFGVPRSQRAVSIALLVLALNYVTSATGTAWLRLEGAAAVAIASINGFAVVVVFVACAIDQWRSPAGRAS